MWPWMTQIHTARISNRALPGPLLAPHESYFKANNTHTHTHTHTHTVATRLLLQLDLYVYKDTSAGNLNESSISKHESRAPDSV